MTHVEWQFGGWLRDWPPSLAAALLGTLAVAGTIYIVGFYRRTLGELKPAVRTLLMSLRAIVVLLLLLCLANPVRVESIPAVKPARGTLAVVVDRSASMNAPDHRGNTRLADAIRGWKQGEAEATAGFEKIAYYRFASELKSAGSFEEAVAEGSTGDETQLFSALTQTIETGPAAIVCLTDGLDTSSGDIGKLVAVAASRNVPIYFVPGQNRAVPMASLFLREVKVPSQVMRKTRFTATAVIEMVAARDGELPVELWWGEQQLASARLPVKAGKNTMPWAVGVTSGEPGPMHLEFRVGDNPREVASCTSAVVENSTVETLYYQGALQWGYHFLRGALESDSSFRLTAILNPALKIKLDPGRAGHSELADLPDDARDLKPFGIVVLAHIFADQLSSRQQTALVEYVRDGGGVLFISPDTRATARFSGTALEEMLPVVFTSTQPTTPEDILARRFRAQMTSIAGSPGSAEGSAGPVVLTPFAKPPDAHASATSSLLDRSDPDALPKFFENAKVQRVKSGAEVLAVSDPGVKGGAPEVLLTRQQFGQGFAAALTTDLLWRWKMSLPSDSRAVEKFWQQLLLSLVPGTGKGLRLTRSTAMPFVNSPVALRIDASSDGGLPGAVAVSPSGERIRLSLEEISAAESAAWSTTFTPPAPGSWEVRVTNSLQHAAHVIFSVNAREVKTELLNLPADLAGMRQLGESTGGGLMDQTGNFRSLTESNEKSPVKRFHSLWNSGWLLGTLLGVYAIELIVRRRARLL